MKSKDPIINKIVNAFNKFNPEKIEVLDQFYDPETVFQDPAVKLQGLNQLKKYYAAVYRNVKSIHFEFHDVQKTPTSYFAIWTMTLSASGLNSGKKFSVEGISILEFNKKELVTFHRDYVDLGAMVYEKLPILGKLIKVVKKQLAHGH